MPDAPAARVELTVSEGVAHLRLVRADARNAIDRAMVDALERAASTCAHDPDVRALLITAAGPSFTVGGDLDHLYGALERLPTELDEMIATFHRALVRLADLAVPVVCAVQGAAAGGGLGLLWCADVVIAAEDAKLVAGFAELALSGDGGSSWFLPRVIGLRRAQEMMLGNRALSATEAAEWGLVNQVVPADRLTEQARRIARELAAGPTAAYGEMRRLLRRAFCTSLDDQLEAERRAMVRCADTADAREGITAFGERRAPTFAGHDRAPTDA
ncbi:MAG TPA: enoyl-CoA hydratase-related protein [Solirubrobacteraceae bacterium]|jgi:2-(1,2-epoxy-1,2-dihydrophenyl)acetyl-CoA isomerase|nr:enoyl-CoA hydratase-related protein [Solirubrobacteraceae bacterium]